MKILALEFSSPQRSVAVSDGGRLVAEAIETGEQRTQAFTMIESVLRDAHWEREQIECLVIGLGPGSYTGIRAALSLAQGWQLARGVKLLGISSVEAIAHELTGESNIVIDAQRKELYLATYQDTKETRPLKIVSPSEAQPLGGTFVGPEVTRWFPAGRIMFPRAAALARLATGRTEFTPGEKLEPIYLRETTFVKAPPSRIIP